MGNNNIYKQRSLKQNQTRCRHMSFSADEEMRFQASCEGGRGQCRQTQFSWYTVPSNGPETAKFLWPMVVAVSVARRVCRRRPTAGVDVLWDERPAGRAQQLETGVLSPADICDWCRLIARGCCSDRQHVSQSARDQPTSETNCCRATSQSWRLTSYIFTFYE